MYFREMVCSFECRSTFQRSACSVRVLGLCPLQLANQHATRLLIGAVGGRSLEGLSAAVHARTPELVAGEGFRWFYLVAAIHAEMCIFRAEATVRRPMVAFAGLDAQTAEHGARSFHFVQLHTKVGILCLR